jgi:hypothetical protein
MSYLLVSPDNDLTYISNSMGATGPTSTEPLPKNLVLFVRPQQSIRNFDHFSFSLL